MKGAKRICATSPTGAVEWFGGDALRIDVEAGPEHWTIHEIRAGNTEMALVGIVPKTWTVRLVLQ